MSRSRTVLFCVAVLSLCVPASRAAVITFIATGTTQDGSTLSGNVVIDTTAGTVDSLSLTASAPDSVSVNFVGNTFPSGGEYTILAWQSSVPSAMFMNLTVLAPTLVGYAGGAISALPCNTCSPYSYVALGGGAYDLFTAGSLTPTPEPAGAPLAAGGLLLMATLWGRRSFVVACRGAHNS